jgi:phosphoglycolate phosphatase
MVLPELFAFDLDGTLVDSREDITRACNHARVTFGMAPLSATQVSELVGDGARVLVAKAFGLDVTSPEVEAPLAAFHAFYVEHAADTTTLLPGIPELLAWLAPRTKLAVCTNKPRRTSERVLDALRLSRTFPVIYGGGDGPLKPDPAGMHACCKQTGVAPSRAIIVGDSAQDVLCGKGAGTQTCGLLTEIFIPGQKLRAAAPDLLFSDAHALLAHFAGA